MSKNSREDVGPIVLGVIFVLFVLLAGYYKDIVRWLYAHELWLVPIQINY